MEITKLIGRISQYILGGIFLAGFIWSLYTGHSIGSSKFLYFGIIGFGIISGVSQVIYLIQAKEYKELKQFFLGVIIIAAVIWFLIAADETVFLFGI